MCHVVFANHYSMIHGSLYYSKLLVTQNDFHYFISFDLQLYGSTKCGLKQLQASLLKERKRTKVGVHTASPGMVLTDLLLRYGIYIPAFCL